MSNKSVDNMHVLSGSNEEIDKLGQDLANNQLVRHTIQFFIRESGSFRPFASGVLAYIQEAHFIVTAAHVIDLSENQDLYIRVGKEKFVSMSGIYRHTDIKKSGGLDIGYIRLDEDMLRFFGEPYKFVTTDKISKHTMNLDGTNYCALGYPEKNFKIVDGIIRTGASYYWAQGIAEKAYAHNKLDPENYFMMSLSGKARDLENGGPKKVDTRFEGISGGGLWYLKFNQDADTKKYLVDYSLIGILTDYRTGKYFCLIANKIKLFMDALVVIEGFQFK